MNVPVGLAALAASLLVLRDGPLRLAYHEPALDIPGIAALSGRAVRADPGA